jgi:hypothetical protein
MLRARRLVVLAAAALSLVAVSGCANDYTCFDYRDCPAEGGAPEGGVDARVDGHPDGGADAKKDGREQDGSAGDGGSDVQTSDAGDAKGDVETCDGTQAPSVASCVISEAYGVFVAPAANGGSDSGAGTRVSPYATITKALGSLGSLTRVYVCNGAYTDQVTVAGAVGIFGGLTCGSGADGGTLGPWVYAAGTHAIVAGSAPAFAIEVNAGSAVVDVEDMEFDGAPGTTASPSSIAAFATGSSNVTLRRVTLTAGAGAPGIGGAVGAIGALVSTTVNGVALASPSLNGQAAAGTTGGSATMCTCSVGGTTEGGAGGSNTTGGDADGTLGLPVQTAPTPATSTGAGSTGAACTASNTNGSNGSSAVPLVEGDGPAAAIGALDTTGWHPGGGTVGTNGAPGQGGGGGGIAPGGAGGGGACGGCGGSGGGFGAGGGASVALLAFDSPVQLFSAILTAAQAGAGGAGAAGGTGIAGGMRGSGTSCNGGNGGTGSTGGAGGGGAGGVSIGILYQGTPPVSDAMTTVTPGTAGAAGAGGDPGVNNGAPGVSVATQNASAL